jgi:hypothetical protein
MLVGVGSYPHLPDGEDPRLARNMGLTQLSSPPVSAKALATWFLTRHRNTSAPLATVELLLSPSQSFDSPGRATVSIEAATMANVAQAFNRVHSSLKERAGVKPVLTWCFAVRRGVCREW